MIAIVLFTLGALNAMLALTVETCTQGSADSLYGGFLTLLLYLAGTAALLVSSPSWRTFAALVPAAALAAVHSTFAVRFAWGYWLHDMSACYAMNGGFTPEDAGEWMDGGEPILTLLWGSVSLLFWTGFVLGLMRREHAERRT